MSCIHRNTTTTNIINNLNRPPSMDGGMDDRTEPNPIDLCGLAIVTKEISHSQKTTTQVDDEPSTKTERTIMYDPPARERPAIKIRLVYLVMIFVGP
jgi:hypothetical protein